MALASNELTQLESFVGEVETRLSPGTPAAVEDAQAAYLSMLQVRVLAEGEISLGDALLQFARTAHPQHALEANELLRVIGAGGPILPGGLSGEVSRAVVAIVQGANLELASLLGLDDKRQTYEKYEAIRGVHRRLCEILSPFDSLQPDIDALLASRKMLARALGDSLTRVYCGPFRLAEVKAGIDTVFGKLMKLRNDSGTHAAIIFECKEAIDAQVEFCRGHPNFLVESCFQRFLTSAANAVDKVLQSIRGRFLAPITARLSTGDELQKRHPLREVGRRTTISIPLKNAGPGTASNVQAFVDADPEKLLLASDELFLGSVAPGDFAAAFEVEIMSASDTVDLLITVEWDEAGAAERRKIDFMVVLAAQRCDIPWATLEYERPYTTEVAKGEQFLGRSEKVKALAAKILRSPMESFYVTGQKRVGKTSLAIAAAEFAKSRHRRPGWS